MLIALLAVFFSLAAIENSVVPMAKFLESNANRHQKKYTKNQYKEIEAALKNSDQKLRIASFNMLRDDLDTKYILENRWEKRFSRIIEVIEEMSPDLIGAQELSQLQANQLIEALNEYAFVGEPRKDGEINGIFYRKNRLEIVSAKSIPIHTNNLNLAEFKDLKTGKRFAHLNIHARFSRVNHREHEARLIAEQAAILAPQMTVLVTGDVNTFPNRTDLDLPFYDGDYIHRILTSKTLQNAQELSLLGHLGPIGTYTSKHPRHIGFEGTGTPGVVLDRIYVSEPITVLIHATQPATVDGYFPSDHMPIFIDFLIP